MSFKEWNPLMLMVLLFASSCTSTAPPIPPITQTPALVPTSTTVASSTPMPTASDTPVPTSTPEGGIITDDFSSRSEIWGDCENCEWKDGALYFGPFPPFGSGQNQIFYLICIECREHMYYRVAADVTYLEGYGADRTFGILAGLTSNDFMGAGTVTTSQHALYETFDFNSNTWGGTPFRQFGAVRPGRATNRVEVVIKPGSMVGRADIFVNVNGENVIVQFNQSVEPSRVGLYLGWHSVGVIYDNFEFEVLKSVQ
jgi:hypothetical protein